MVFQAALPVIGYQLNKEYIASELCENKDVVASCCEGSCYLDKKIKKAQEDEEQSPSLRVELITEYISKNNALGIDHKKVPADFAYQVTPPSYRFVVKTCDPKRALKPPTV